jgi:phage tail sheath gpL-like
MPINTGIPSSLQPKTLHRFMYLLGGRSLVPLPLRIALVGIMDSTGSGVAGTVYDITDVNDAEEYFGVGSELTLMVKKALETCQMLNRGPAISAVGIADPAGTAATYTLTWAGTATEGGYAYFEIAGRKFAVNVASGDLAATVATNAEAIIDAAVHDLPCVAGVAGAIVTLTHNHTGENGNDVEVTAGRQPAGLTLTAAAAVVGVGVTDITASLNALAGIDVDGIAIANHKAADITDALAHIADMWDPAEKKWRWIFLGERGSVATATALASAANQTAIVVGNCEDSPSLPGEIAACLCAAVFGRERPNAGYNKLRVPLYPPPMAQAFTTTEIETALLAGVTPLSPIADVSSKSLLEGVLKIERLVTTKTEEDSNPFTVLRDIGVSRTGAYLARQADANYSAKFGPNADDPDGVLNTDDTKDRIRDMLANLLYDAQDLKIVKNVEADLSLLQIEDDELDAGRLNIDLPYTVVGLVHQLAILHRVKL